MNGTTIDGHNVSEDDRGFALSVSDVLPGDMLSDRLSRITELSDICKHLRFVCVRNDSMSLDLFKDAASATAETGLGLILESGDPLALYGVVSSLPDRRPLLCITDVEKTQEAAVLSSVTGCPMAVGGRGTEDLMENVEAAEGCGATGIVLCPGYTSMKGCLETNTDLHRLASEHSFPQSMHPVMSRTWSGEYALAVASVSVMTHGSLIVLDDLDPDGCEVLDSLMNHY